MIGGSPVCLECKHFHADRDKPGLTCDAFPEGIPDSILIQGNDHKSPVAGDHGIRFEPEEAESSD